MTIFKEIMFFSKIESIWIATNVSEFGRHKLMYLTLTCPIALPPHTPVAQKNAGLCTLIASLVQRLFVRVDWTEGLRDDLSATDRVK